MVACSIAEHKRRRWLIGVQLRATAQDYRDRKAFEDRLSEAVAQALRDPRLDADDEKLVALPEHIGTWLAVADEIPAVYAAKTITAAMGWLLISNPGFLRHLLAAAIRRRRWDFLGLYFFFGCLLSYKAAAMRRVYEDVCSRLAKRHGVTLVAGSTTLPKPADSGKPDAPLYNVAYTFGPDGRVLHEARKVHPIIMELGFLAPEPASSLTAVDTPLGRVGVLICADGFYPDVYARLRQTDVLVQPSFGEHGLEDFDKPWRDYRGGVNPPDAGEPPDGLTEKGAWRRYALAARIRGTEAQAGINVFLAGQLWDMETGGHGLGLKRAGASWESTEVPTDLSRDTFIYVPLFIN